MSKKFILCLGGLIACGLSAAIAGTAKGLPASAAVKEKLNVEEIRDFIKSGKWSWEDTVKVTDEVMKEITFTKEDYEGLTKNWLSIVKRMPLEFFKKFQYRCCGWADSEHMELFRVYAAGTKVAWIPVDRSSLSYKSRILVKGNDAQVKVEIAGRPGQDFSTSKFQDEEWIRNPENIYSSTTQEEVKSLLFLESIYQSIKDRLKELGHPSNSDGTTEDKRWEIDE